MYSMSSKYYMSRTLSTTTSFIGPSSSASRSSRGGVPITSKIFSSWCVSARNSSPKRSFCSFSLRLELSGKHELPRSHLQPLRRPGKSG